jgi:hypothetical protein
MQQKPGSNDDVGSNATLLLSQLFLTLTIMYSKLKHSWNTHQAFILFIYCRAWKVPRDNADCQLSSTPILVWQGLKYRDSSGTMHVRNLSISIMLYLSLCSDILPFVGLRWIIKFCDVTFTFKFTFKFWQRTNVLRAMEHMYFCIYRCSRRYRQICS